MNKLPPENCIKCDHHFFHVKTREASTSFWLESELMEWLLDAVGAVMGKTGCRDMVACRWYSSNHCGTVYRAFE